VAQKRKKKKRNRSQVAVSTTTIFQAFAQTVFQAPKDVNIPILIIFYLQLVFSRENGFFSMGSRAIELSRYFYEALACKPKQAYCTKSKSIVPTLIYSLCKRSDKTHKTSKRV
jgi:hypothetical protein